MKIKNFINEFTNVVFVTAYLSLLSSPFLYLLWNCFLVKYAIVSLSINLIDAFAAVFFFQLMRHYTFTKIDILLHEISRFSLMAEDNVSDNNEDDSERN